MGTLVAGIAAGGPRPAGAVVILNEYNAVRATVTTGFNDATFGGAVRGNGGRWAEFLVVGSGSAAGETVDLRGYSFSWVGGDVTSGGTGDPRTTITTSGSFVLTNDDLWATVQRGTLLTFVTPTINASINSGAVAAMATNAATYAPATGSWWINVNMLDSTSPYVNGTLNTGNDNWQVTIRDTTGGLVFKAGEGFSGLSGISSSEVGKLESWPAGDPRNTLANWQAIRESNPDGTPFAGTKNWTYTEGSSSSFGAANLWSGGSFQQDFSVLRNLDGGGGGDPPPNPDPPYTGGYAVNPATRTDSQNVTWGDVTHWIATSSTVGFSFLPPAAGDTVTVNKLTEGRRNVDLGGTRAIGSLFATVNGNDDVNTDGGVRYRAGTLRFDTGTSGSTASVVTYSGTGAGRLEFKFDAEQQAVQLANDLRVVADNTAGRVDFRGTLTGSHTITKAGAGEMRFSPTFASGTNLFNTGGFTGGLVVEEGVLRLSHQTPLSATAGITVADGGQLRLDGVGSSGDFTYDLGPGSLTIAGFGRDPELGFGSSSGAIRQHDGVEGQTATIANDIVLAANAGVHVEGFTYAYDEDTGIETFIGGTLLNLAGDLSGPGMLRKTGGARLILSGSNSSGGLDVRSGTVTIASAHALAVAPLRFESETSERTLELFGNHVVTSFDGDSPDPLLSVEGVPNTNTLTLRLGGAGTALTVNQAFASGTDELGGLVEQSTRFQGDMTGAGGFVKDGDGLLAFTRYAKTYSGSTTIREGVLEVSAGGVMNATAGVAVESGGQLRLSTSGSMGAPAIYTFGGSADRTVALAGNGRAGLPADSGLGTSGALRYEPGGGPGEAVLANAVVLAAHADIHVSGTDKTLTLSGPVTGAGGLTKTGAGTLVLTGSTGYAGTTRIDVGRLALGAAATASASPRIEVGAGTTFDVTAKAGGYAVAAGQTLAGSGTVVGSVSIGTAATLAPGASPGTLTVTQNVSWGTGGSYNWQVANFAGTAGSASGWDLLSVGGVLNVAATTASPFAINVWSLAGTGPDVNGPAANFNATQNGSWKIASAAGGITNFSADKFTVVTGSANGTGGFANDLAGGTFSVVQSANDILLNFTAATVQADPVKVKGVYAAGTGWNATYAALAPFSTVGGTAAGWKLRDGAVQTSGSSALTWSNLNRFTIEFDQAIATPAPGALKMILGTGTGNRVFTPTAVSLLAGGSAAQWTLPAVLANGSYVLSLASAGIQSADGGVALDGEWQTDVSTFAQGSGDGEAGGIFNFAFDVLIGDVRSGGLVNNTDNGDVRGHLFKAVTAANFRSDLNGSNSINNTDIGDLRRSLFVRTSNFIDPVFPTENLALRSFAGALWQDDDNLVFADMGSLDFGITGIVTVPEPTTAAAAAMAAAALAFRMLRRRRAPTA